MADDTVPVREILGAATGDQHFESFVRTETPGLLRTAYLLTGSPAAAEDVVQETLTRLYPRWARVRGANRPAAYVHRSLVNTYLNSIRSASSREMVAAEIGERADRADLAQTITDRDLLWRMLSHLPDRQRVALVLRYYNDLTDRDIARTLGCRAATVRSLISRGLATLRTDAQLGSHDA